MSDRCWLVDASGKLVDIDTDSKLDFHFDCMLDKVVEWKKHAPQDSNLLGKFRFLFLSHFYGIIGLILLVLLYNLVIFISAYVFLQICVTLFLVLIDEMLYGTDQLLKAHEACKTDESSTSFTPVCCCYTSFFAILHGDL